MTAVGCGALSALLFLSLLVAPLAGLILSNFAALPIFAVGLSAGFAASVVAGVTAAGVVLASTQALPWAVGFLVLFAAPAAFVVSRALRWSPRADGTVAWYGPGRLLVWLARGGVGVILLGALLTLGQPDGLRGLLRTTLGQAGQLLSRLLEDGAVYADPAFADAMLRVFPGQAVASLLLLVVVNAALAQGLLMRMGRNLRPPMRMAEVDLPGWMAAAFGIAVFAAVASPSLVGWYGYHVAVVLAGAYLVAGLGVVHAFAHTRRRGGGLALAVVYGILLFPLTFGPAAMVLVGLGVTEHWARLKQRFSRPGRDQEDV
ncbi:MAG TPA: DUF2232 domain-containing protein [Azospirillaceae bacterium]|nr:DUF2232 domain-containing protein [Azospirillaceae bacterium]